MAAGPNELTNTRTMPKAGLQLSLGVTHGNFLFMGVRNKFCAVCAVASNKGIDALWHRCYCNWSGSSAAMESDIIAEGFSLSDKKLRVALHVCRW